MEEILIAYDAQGCPQSSASRDIIHKRGLWHKVVHVWFYDEHHLYFQQRSLAKKAFPGGYDITLAGHIDPDEDGIVAAIRECKEELGICLDPQQLHFLGTYREEMQLEEGMDREIAEVYISKQSISPFQLGEEVIDLGSITISSLVELLSGEKQDVVFTSLFNQKVKRLQKETCLIHEPAYYLWLLSHMR